MTLRKKTILFLSSGCLLGNMPFAPGTFGTLPGLPICWLLSRMHVSISLFLIALAIPFAIWVSGEAERILGKKDPGSIVIDEVMGMVVTMAGLPFNAISMDTKGSILSLESRLSSIIRSFRSGLPTALVTHHRISGLPSWVQRPSARILCSSLIGSLK